MIRKTLAIVYEFICKNPGLSTYEISKKLRLSGGKVRYSISKLEKIGLIKCKFVSNPGRIKKLSFPIKSFTLIDRKIKSKLSKIKF